MPFVIGNNPAYSHLLDTSVFPNGTDQMDTHARHISPLISGDMAGKPPWADLTWGLGLKCTPIPALNVDHGDLPVSDRHVSYSAFDPMTYLYGAPPPLRARSVAPACTPRRLSRDRPGFPARDLALTRAISTPRRR